MEIDIWYHCALKIHRKRSKDESGLSTKKDLGAHTGFSENAAFDGESLYCTNRTADFKSVGVLLRRLIAFFLSRDVHFSLTIVAEQPSLCSMQ